MPDEDSDVEKLSPLLEAGINFETDVAPRIEISMTELTNESKVSKNPESEENQTSPTRNTPLPENVNPVSSSSCSIDAGKYFLAIT